MEASKPNGRRPVRPLTDAQRDLAATCVPLAFYLARRFSLSNGTLVPLEEYQREAALGLCDAARAFDPSRGFSFRTLAWTAINRRLFSAAREHAKRARRGVEPLELWHRPVDGYAGPYRVAEVRDELDAIKRALPPELWIVLVLHFRDGLDYKTIAQRIGCTRATVSGRVQRAIRAAKEVCQL